jgi:hypothetical protein
MQSLAKALDLSQWDRSRFETAARMPAVRADARGVQSTNLSGWIGWRPSTTICALR